MKAIETRALKLLVNQWDNIKTQLDRLSLPAARPADGYGIFSLIEHPRVAGQIGFEIAPVTFKVPERAKARAPVDIYIIARGQIYVDQDTLKNYGALKTVCFATEVGYFRMRRGKLDHIFGAHYDFSLNEIGHPIFHAQMRSYNDRGRCVSNAFQLDCEPNDLIKDVFRGVRLPTAQMDFFALVLQICADHLVSKDSGVEEKKAFADLCRVSHAIQGAGHLWAELAKAPSCMRAPHWYK